MGLEERGPLCSAPPGKDIDIEDKRRHPEDPYWVAEPHWVAEIYWVAEPYRVAERELPDDLLHALYSCATKIPVLQPPTIPLDESKITPRDATFMRPLAVLVREVRGGKGGEKGKGEGHLGGCVKAASAQQTPGPLCDALVVCRVIRLQALPLPAPPPPPLRIYECNGVNIGLQRM